MGSVTTRTARLPRPSPWLVDAVVTGALAVVGVAMLFVYTNPIGIEFRDGDALGIAIVAAATIPLMFRRRWPIAVGLITAAALLPLTIWDYSAPTAVVIILIAVYTAGNHADILGSLTVTAAHTGMSTAYSIATSARYPEQSQIDGASITINFLLLLGMWAIGRAVRNRRLYTAELEDRAQRLQSAGEAEVRAAITQERSRIARELHDVVAHHVSVMTVQAAGARRSLTRDPDRSAEVLLSVEATGRAALSEMRRVVGVLRGPDDTDESDDGAGLSPQPGLAELGDLAEHMRAAGLPTTVAVDGEPGSVPIGVDVTAYRIIQEALTNTIKHAGPSTASVLVRYSSDEIRVTIADDGNGMAAALETHRKQSKGHGLLGMRERVALYGGSLAVGPRQGGGFEVRARIPLDDAAVSR